MKQGLIRRLEHLEQRDPRNRPKPWVVLMPGQEPPEGWEATHGGIVRVKIYDARKRMHDQELDDPDSQESLNQ